MRRHSHHQGHAQGPSQRQLRAGELMRHALVEILREEEISDPALAGVSVTVTEVRMSPDLRHATVFAEPLGGGHAPEVIEALNRHARFLRGRLGHAIDMKFTPDLKFLHDESFEEAAKMSRLFADPRVAQDLSPQPPSDSWKDED
jgi:ribosome-binding factor A